MVAAPHTDWVNPLSPVPTARRQCEYAILTFFSNPFVSRGMVARHKKVVVMMCGPESDDWRHIKSCPLPSLGCGAPREPGCLF